MQDYFQRDKATGALQFARGGYPSALDRDIFDAQKWKVMLVSFASQDNCVIEARNGVLYVGL